MTAWLPVSSKGLRRRTLITPEWTLARAGLFPFFNRAGVISRVMVVDAESSQLWFFDPGRAELRIPLFGPIMLQPFPSTLRRLDESQRTDIKCSWHFDPWWVLGDARFVSSGAAQALKATNCLERFPWAVSSLYYRRDLTQVSMILRRKKQGQELVRFPRDVLPEGPTVTIPSPPRPHTKIGWKLDPFWRPTKR